jgi:hypothetical protein
MGKEGFFAEITVGMILFCVAVAGIAAVLIWLLAGLATRKKREAEWVRKATADSAVFRRAEFTRTESANIARTERAFDETEYIGREEDACTEVIDDKGPEEVRPPRFEAKYCGTCGEKLLEEGRFCMRCGAQIR